MPAPPLPPAARALLAQVCGCAIALALRYLQLLPPGILPAVGAQAAGAAASAALLGSARWWIPIHLCFAPLVLATLQLRLPPWSFLTAFTLLLLVYWSSFRTQVPLFLSNRATAASVLEILDESRGLRLLDLGSGTGALLRPLATARPDARFIGMENAPVPYLLSRLLARALPNLAIRRADFFREDWSAYDYIYAFLSPAPMAKVWEKACREMRPGAVLICNSFPVPGVEAWRRIEVDDRRGTTLYLYQPGALHSQDQN